MSYTAEVIRVMIASPSDVAAERNIVRQVLIEWNSIHSFARRIVLLPIGWETHSTPEMGARPQQIINKQILKDCDLLIGVFWTRIGTSTGDHASGTVEEIEEHIAAGKPAMLYFSEVPVALSSVDADQYKRLVDFKKSTMGRGLVDTYSDVTEFHDKVRRQIQMKMNSDPYLATRGTTGPASSSFSTVVTNNDALVPDLSAEARQLLVEAAGSQDGHIMFLRYIGGVSLQTNGKEFIEGGSARTRATWQSALEELATESLIRDLGHKGEIFELTKDGYEVAEILKK